ncbi:MAG: hypothetical protein KA715_12615 [Xanthomonadaceae bacterium]|nr:hypothetical protein [Xanthomonadaceae bacterium]
MATRLRVKNKKRNLDRLTAYKKNPVEQTHKIAVGRARKIKLKKAYRMA